MMHDDKVTEPLLINTPPLCKRKRKTGENSIGAMGNFEREAHIESLVPTDVAR
jgi:hypothetical protein